MLDPKGTKQHDIFKTNHFIIYFYTEESKRIRLILFLEDFYLIFRCLVLQGWVFYATLSAVKDGNREFCQQRVFGSSVQTRINSAQKTHSIFDLESFENPYCRLIRYLQLPAKYYLIQLLSDRQ